jgi:hypothetical protein
MSQGIFKALEYLEDQIESITPKSDLSHTFVAHNRANGMLPPLEQRRSSNRYFELELESLPEDDGAAGLSGRRRALCVCRVRYDIPNDLAYRQRMMAEDAEYILTKLKGPDYSLSTTGIVSVIPEPPLLVPVEIDNTIAHILSVPFTLLYLEA